MKLRNKINEQEGQHQEMFETINEKLQDESFIQQAIDMKGKQQISVKSRSKTHDEGAGKNAVSSESDAGMSDADVKCYEARYSDLEGKGGREHYLEIGTNKGRLRTCAVNITDFEAKRYLDTNPDLQHEFGRGSVTAKEMARNHWADYGYK